MKALTICQRYAHLIILGEKPLENRTWWTSYRGPLAIHAGKSRAWLDEGDLERYPDMAFGAVIGTVEVVDCVAVGKLKEPLASNEHANGPFCLVMENPVMFAEPIPARGALGLWDWQPDGLSV